MNQERIGKFIAELRKEKNMTQQDLATKLNVTDRAISNWENGRRLPDYSLIKNLCDELGITINELLSGERLKKEEQTNKFEENIINTLSYSNKKERNIRKVSICLISIIAIIILILLTLFGIDVIRMRNNEPVFFSTWGFKYAPAINIDSLKIEKTIKEYIAQKSESGFDDDMYYDVKSFVTMRTFLIKEENNTYYVYAWVLEETFARDLKNDNVVNYSGFSIPHKFKVIKNGDEYIVDSYEIPGDGTAYARDLKKIFPAEILPEIDQVYFDGTYEKLDIDLKEQVELYYHTDKFQYKTE